MFRRLWSGLPPDAKFPSDLKGLGFVCPFTLFTTTPARTFEQLFSPNISNKLVSTDTLSTIKMKSAPSKTRTTTSNSSLIATRVFVLANGSSLTVSASYVYAQHTQYHSLSTALQCD